MSKKKCGASYKPNDLDECIVGYISHVEENGSFYIVSEDNIQYMYDQVDKLNLLLRKSQHLTDVEIGQIVCSKNSVDKSWYRACIKAITVGGKYLVTLIDYGKTETVTLDQLRNLPKEMNILKTPPFATKCTLHGLGKKIHKEQIQKLKTMTDQTMDILFRKMEKNACEVELYKDKNCVATMLGMDQNIKSEDSKRIDNQEGSNNPVSGSKNFKQAISALFDELPDIEDEIKKTAPMKVCDLAAAYIAFLRNKTAMSSTMKAKGIDCENQLKRNMDKQSTPTVSSSAESLDLNSFDKNYVRSLTLSISLSTLYDMLPDSAGIEKDNRVQIVDKAVEYIKAQTLFLSTADIQATVEDVKYNYQDN